MVIYTWLGTLGVWSADATARVGEQRETLRPIAAGLLKEPIDRRLEPDKRRMTLLPRRGLIAKPPQPLDQVEIARASEPVRTAA
jgi:hypothetical protein